MFLLNKLFSLQGSWTVYLFQTEWLFGATSKGRLVCFYDSTPQGIVVKNIYVTCMAINTTRPTQRLIEIKEASANVSPDVKYFSSFLWYMFLKPAYSPQRRQSYTTYLWQRSYKTINLSCIAVVARSDFSYALKNLRN